MKTFTQFSESIEQRRQQLQQRQIDAAAAQQQRVADYQAMQKQKIAAQREKEDLTKEITAKVKKELQTEQTPTMQPNLYNQLIARQQAYRKRARESHAQREMEHEASAQQAAKRARMKEIMGR